MFTIREAIELLSDKKVISNETAYKLHQLRKFRNLVVHEPKNVSQEQLDYHLHEIKEVSNFIL
jgi:uncharacterized protein YutE (UPF0331/DUF86 family)